MNAQENLARRPVKARINGLMAEGIHHSCRATRPSCALVADASDGGCASADYAEAGASGATGLPVRLHTENPDGIETEKTKKP